MQTMDRKSKTVHMVECTATAQKAAQVMAMNDIGFLPVVHDQTIVGAITDRDLALRVVAAGHDPARTAVAAVMSRGEITENEGRIAYGLSAESLPSDMTIDDALRYMEDRQVSRVGVHDSNSDHRVIAIISRGDLLRAETTPSA